MPAAGATGFFGLGASVHSLRSWLAAAAIAACGLSATSAMAGSYTFTFDGAVYDISGAFTTANVANADVTYDITSATGTVSSSDSSLPQGAFTLGFGDPIVVDGHSTFIHGGSTFDNVYRPADTGFAGNGLEIFGADFALNVYGGSTGYPSHCPTNCAAGSFPGRPELYEPGDVGALSFAAVPEPATWAMMALAFGPLGGMLRARRKPGMALSAA